MQEPYVRLAWINSYRVKASYMKQEIPLIFIYFYLYFLKILFF